MKVCEFVIVFFRSLSQAGQAEEEINTFSRTFPNKIPSLLNTFKSCPWAATVSNSPSSSLKMVFRPSCRSDLPCGSDAKQTNSAAAAAAGAWKPLLVRLKASKHAKRGLPRCGPALRGADFSPRGQVKGMPVAGFTQPLRCQFALPTTTGVIRVHVHVYSTQVLLSCRIGKCRERVPRTLLSAINRSPVSGRKTRTRNPTLSSHHPSRLCCSLLVGRDEMLKQREERGLG